MQQAEAELSAAVNAKPHKPRHAPKARFARDAARFSLCVFCGSPLNGHTTAEMQTCSNGRS